MSRAGSKQQEPRKAAKQPGKPGRRKGTRNGGKKSRTEVERERIEQLLATAIPKKTGEPRGRGRPRIELDRSQLVAFARAGCTNEEIAGAFGVSEETLSNNYSEELRLGRADGRVSLRTTQMMLAEHGNVNMLIWLGKQYLGQADRVDGNQTQSHTVKYLGPGIDPNEDLGPQSATRDPNVLTPGAPVPEGGDVDEETGEPRAALDQSPIGTPEVEEFDFEAHERGEDGSANGNQNGNGNSSIEPPLPEGFTYDDERWKNESNHPSPEDGRR